MPTTIDTVAAASSRPVQEQMRTAIQELQAADVGVLLNAPTVDQKAALDAANDPDADNPLATIDDLGVAANIEALDLTVSDPPEQAEVQAIADGFDALLVALKAAGLMEADA